MAKSPSDYGTWAAFGAALRAAFEPVLPVVEALTKLPVIHQQGQVSDYILAFKLVEASLGITDFHVNLDYFCKGLNLALRNKVLSTRAYYPPCDTLFLFILRQRVTLH